ncbi:hypothetical protein HZS_8166 [Henneguya salminicola]|nr:hypothetical protein HZS_8166 [Henneguya salminicola]
MIINISSQFTQSNPYLNPNSYENNYNIDETKFENRKNKKKVRFSDQVKKTPTKSCENNDSEYDEKYSYQFTGMNDKEYDSENSTNWENIHKSGIPKNRNIYQDDEDKFEKIYVRNNKGDFVLLKQNTNNPTYGFFSNMKRKPQKCSKNNNEVK